MEKKKLLISFSGGRTSAFMTYWLLKNKRQEYDMVVVFSNTGKEREETLEFVRDCDKFLHFNTVWIESETNPLNNYGASAKVVTFETANRDGKPFEDVIKKHGLPNQETPHCSRQLKAVAIRAYARSIRWIGKNYMTAIGIRADEPHRINMVTAKKNHLIYPLVEMVRTVKSDVNLFWLKQDFDLRLKSYEGNCDFCWKKSFRKLMTIAKENPQLTEWWKNMEEKYENFLPEFRRSAKVKLPFRMFRDNSTVNDIIEDSKFDFIPATDESKEFDKWKQMSMFNSYIDSNAGCVESCEAF